MILKFSNFESKMSVTNFNLIAFPNSNFRYLILLQNIFSYYKTLKKIVPKNNDLKLVLTESKYYHYSYRHHNCERFNKFFYKIVKRS